MWKTMDESALKGKKVAELREIAKTFGLKNYQKMKKAELVQALMKDDEPPKKAEQAGGEEVSAEPDHVMAGSKHRISSCTQRPFPMAGYAPAAGCCPPW